MTMTENSPRLRETTPEALAETRDLLAKARHGALATLDPADGHPMVSRVSLALLADGTPFVLVSDLSLHSGALRADSRCSLLVGDVGKGDPLAHPRVTLKCRAEDLPRGAGLRQRFLASHPKAELYIDLADFSFFRLQPQTVSYVAGFGRAYRFSGARLLSS
jgi:putative heme iron utilization protein